MTDTTTGEWRALCDSTANSGSYVCCRPAGHVSDHECRNFRAPDGELWARWDDAEADVEPFACVHEEMEHVGRRGRLESGVYVIGTVVLRCTRCGVTYLQVDDPEGPITLDDTATGTTRRIRYEEVHP